MGQYTYRYPHPAVAADCVVLGYDGRHLRVLLIERRHDPCGGMWAFPGGFMEIDETADAAARRELKEETSLEVGEMWQIGVFSDVHRDPRERVLSVAFLSLTCVAEVRGGDDAARARWWPMDSLPPLAFDHADMLRQAVGLLRRRIRFAPVGLGVLPEVFAKDHLQQLYEAIVGHGIDISRLLAWLLQNGVVQQVEMMENQIDARFVFVPERYNRWAGNDTEVIPFG